MQDYNSIINRMNQKIFFKLNKIKVVPDEEGGKRQTVEEFMGTTAGFGFGQQYHGDRYPGDRGSTIDVADVQSVDEPYVTHRSHSIIPDHIVRGRNETDDEEDDKHFVDITPEDKIREQGEDIPAPEATPAPADKPLPAETAGTPPTDITDVGEPGLGAEPGMGMEPGLGGEVTGIPGQEEPKDPTELGRTYEMKKIYARLVSMNEYLSDEMSPNMLKTKRAIAKAIDLFAVIGANPDSYKDRIDEIIVSYYKFLEAAYKKVKSFYRGEATRVGGLPENLEQNDEDETEVRI